MLSQSRTRIFAKYGIGGEISIVTTFFILDYFQGKLLQIFPKNAKKLYSGATLGPFCSSLGKNMFSQKSGLCRFLNNVFPHLIGAGPLISAAL